MTTTTLYGVQITRPDREPDEQPTVIPCDDLADACETQRDWAEMPATPTSTYTVVSCTVTRSDWAPVDPMEARS